MTRRYRVRITPAAESDLDEILGFVSDYGSPAIAEKLLSEFLRLAESLKDFLLRGAIPKELERLGVREFRQLLHRPYRMFYRVEGDEVSVLLIADGRREMRDLLRLRLLR